jgi:transposase-like protein
VNSIITFLIQFNQSLLVKIQELLAIIAQLAPDKSYYDFKSPKYKKFTVDKPPIVRKFEKLDYKVLMAEHLRLFGKPVLPVHRRSDMVVNSAAKCPYCGAPHEYLYDNTGGRGQLLCKVCSNRFAAGKPFVAPLILQCPYCGNSLTRQRERNGFIVHRCMNYHCSFYRHSLSSLSDVDRAEYEQHPGRFKLHYIYREFVTDFFAMDLSSMPGKNVNFQFRKFSPHILGLCLTYVVNLGLSTRMTARALLDIHGVRISHAMVARYVHTASAIVATYVNDYDYKPTNYLAADETYVKVKGVNHYVWFVMDAIKKSILGHAVSSARALEPCMLALRRSFSHFKEFPGGALKFVSDGYSIYNLAQQQFAMKDMFFNLTQVFGLTNEDPVSTEHRWLKQNIERLNRTFKFSYRVTNGYGSFDGADSHVAIFVAYYNFLRPHSYTYWKPLNTIPELERLPNMPAKWQKLIELSQFHLINRQSLFIT